MQAPNGSVQGSAQPKVEPEIPVGDDRDKIAADRDRDAEARDQASEDRNDRADARDERAAAREEAADGTDLDAVADRAGALRDRRGGASDRTQAADDREAAATDRAIAARERAISSIDELTGAYRRDAGTLELEREFSRAKRTNQPVIIAFTDLDDLKATNDAYGHPAGDRRLNQTVASMRAHLRSYDLIVRFGGDEFVCALTSVTHSEAVERFDAVNTDLAAMGLGSISVGLTGLRAEDSLERVLARADDALYAGRNNQS